MPQRFVVIFVILVTLTGGGVALYLVTRPSSPAATPARTSAPTPAPTAPAPSTETSKSAATPAVTTPATAASTPAAAAPPTTGTLRIESDVPETSVFIDRVYLGNAPVTASKLTPGSHHLNLSATGYEGISEDIVVGPGEKTVSIRFKDVHLDAKVEVVHKHGVGSCTGALIATLEGLRYETANKNDAFAAPLADLEVFEVDYLNKNLKVKLKKGRTFNFADSEGNADRLFVFQREVDKVRQRLKGSFK